MRLLHIIHETDMRCSHEGLLVRAKEAGVPLTKMGPGDVIAFLNTGKDRLKVLAFTSEKDGHGILAYYRSPHGRVPLEAIEFIPEAFGGDGFRMDKAIKEGLLKALAKRKQRREEK